VPPDTDEVIDPLAAPLQVTSMPVILALKIVGSVITIEVEAEQLFPSVTV
jgi:hypothetical protein